MNTSGTVVSAPSGRGLQFRYSHAAAIVLLVGVLLTTLPLARADAAIAGLPVIWVGLYLFMRRSGQTLRLWATMMAAIGAWLMMASASGSLARWAPEQGTVSASQSRPAQTSTTGADLRASVHVASGEVLITNRGQQPWLEVSVALDAAAGGAGYVTRLDRVAAGRTVTLPLSRFASADGRAFAASTSPRSLTIDAQVGTAGSRGTYEASWQ